MAATSASGVQTSAVVQGRGVVVAEVGLALWLWQASGQVAMAGWGCWFAGEPQPDLAALRERRTPKEI